MKCITKIKGSYYECEANRDYIKFVPGNEYYIPIARRELNADFIEITDFNEKDYLLDVCKEIDICSAMSPVLLMSLGYNDVYGMDDRTYIKLVYTINTLDGVEDISIQVFLNKYARTIKLLATHGLINAKLLELVKPIEGKFELDEKILDCLSNINDVVGNFSTIFKFEEDTMDLLVRMNDGVKFRKFGVKDNSEGFNLIIGDNYALPYYDSLYECNTLSANEIEADVMDEEAYVLEIANKFEFGFILSEFKSYLTMGTQESIAQVMNTCRLLNDKIICCDSIKPFISDVAKPMDRDMCQYISNELHVANMSGKLGNCNKGNLNNGPMNLF